ncbi:unnamed protein product, partial [marine sediment metagenome]
PGLAYATNVLDRLMVGDYEKYGPRGTGEFSFTPYGNIPIPFLRGALIESWETSPKRLTFHVRRGIYWQAMGKEHVMESREYTAHDLVFNLRRILKNPIGASIVAAGFIKTPYEETIYPVGDFTAVVELERYNIDWPMWLALDIPCVHIAPETVEAGPDEWENLVGTGPFVFDEYVLGSHMGFVRNPDYWRTTIINGVEYELPFIDELIMPFIPDTATRMAALRTGVLDACVVVEPADAASFEMTTPEMLRIE